MDIRLRERLEARLAPDHECTPYHGGCHMPHYWYNHTSPRYRVAWPQPSAARTHVESARWERDWTARLASMELDESDGIEGDA